MKLHVFFLTSVIGLATASADLSAHSRLTGRSGSKASGTVSFKDVEGGSVKVSYSLKNLPKNATLGMHIHEMGDCSAQDASSAGRHYAKLENGNGTSTDAPDRYAGDLPAITTDNKGRAKGSFVAPNLTIAGTNAVSKHAIVIHEGDNDITMPAKARIACGVIVGPPVKVSDKTSASTTAPDAPAPTY
ncbi:MAG: superoxide dismutase family protein [Bdellovibrionaceae bacterium]|nr:superoxide dismutase family protein [Pseudobdellovibrionaceae bacterium]